MKKNNILLLVIIIAELPFVLYFVRDQLIKVRINSNNQKISAFMEDKIFCGRYPWFVFVNSEHSYVKLLNADVNEQALLEVWQVKDERLSLDYQSPNNTILPKDYFWEILYTNKEKSSIRCRYDNITLIDFNGDDIWDIKRVYWNEIEKVDYYILLNASWQLCLSVDSNYKHAILKNKDSYFWSEQEEQWLKNINE